MNRSISILGCGWLGFPLAKKLISLGYRVKGSTTAPSKIDELKKSGIETYLINLSKDLFAFDGRFLESEILFLNIPFRRDFENPFEYYDQIEDVLKYAHSSPIKLILFASSTSVYPENLVDSKEDVVFKPQNNRSEALFKTENLVRNNSRFSSIILRLAGLCGYDRHIGKFLSSQTSLVAGNAPVNIIHRDDCIEIISKLIENNIKDQTFNLCCDGHPTKKELYTKASKFLGLKPPQFKEGALDVQKIVNNQKIKKVLNYSFKYSHPFDCIY